MNTDQAKNSTVIKAWKKEIGELLALQLDKNQVIDFTELESQLDTIIDKNFCDRLGFLHNNYSNKDVRTSLTQISSCILEDICVLGGDACLFFKHDVSLSMNMPIISGLKNKRNTAKAERKRHDKGTGGYIYWDNVQKNVKIVINSLYGVMGYPGFHFYNVNLAKSITATGRSIISTASCGYENFISDSIKFVNFSELMHYVNNIAHEFNENFPKYTKLFLEVPLIETEKVLERIKGKCAFKFTNDEAMMLIKMVTHMDYNLIKLLYFKNNISEFNRVPIIKKLVKELFDNIETLTLGDENAFIHPESAGTVATSIAYDKYRDLKDAYQVMVQYNYPIYDMVRRTRYTDKKAVLYIDTDSNFIGLDPFIRYVYRDIYGERAADYNKLRFKVASVYTMILSDVVARNYVHFTKIRNITPEYGKILAMKNEFFFTRMAFADVKKRYFGWMMIQEGVLIKGGKGDLEIKGFDFIKAGTKATIKNKYQQFVTEILHTEHIDIRGMIDKALEFKEMMREEILQGDASYFKQTTVSIPEHYKNPYSIQGIKGVLIWNAINPTETIDLPAAVDIIPINLARNFTAARVKAIKIYGPDPLSNPEFETVAAKMPGLLEFAKRYPEYYKNFWNNLLNNDEHAIAGLEFNVIAKPRHYHGLPRWLAFIIDSDKIVYDAVSLLTPVLQTTGIKASKVGKSKLINHYNNIVDI